MKNLQISDNDLLGKRFNGHDLHLYLNERGIDSKQLVWNKLSNDPDTYVISGDITNRYAISNLVNSVEQEFLFQSLFYPFSYDLLLNKLFLECDIVHYHLIHNHFFSIAAFPFLSKLKPAVWTVHDPWAMTGHCIHPFDCERWKIGCGDCPRLDTEFAMEQDNTALNWEIKKFYYHNSDIDIVVQTKWLFDLTTQSPLFSKFRVHHIPCGFNLEVFRPIDTAEAKAQMGISPDTLVISFRSSSWKLKGLHYIKDVLHRLKAPQPVCLLTFDREGMVDEFRGRYEIIDLGWVHDEKELVKAYNAADIFLMPSTAENFGTMAAEAMACGTPVIAFQGTGVEGTIFSPRGGIAVPKDVDALLAETERLINDTELRRKIGNNALALAKDQYDVRVNVDKILALYQDVLERRSTSERTTFLISQLKTIAASPKHPEPEKPPGGEEVPELISKERQSVAIPQLAAEEQTLAEVPELNTEEQQLHAVLKRLSQMSIMRLAAYKILLPLARCYRKVRKTLGMVHSTDE